MQLRFVHTYGLSLIFKRQQQSFTKDIWINPGSSGVNSAFCRMMNLKKRLSKNAFGAWGGTNVALPTTSGKFLIRYITTQATPTEEKAILK